MLEDVRVSEWTTRVVDFVRMIQRTRRFDLLGVLADMIEEDQLDVGKDTLFHFRVSRRFNPSHEEGGFCVFFDQFTRKVLKEKKNDV